jgi:hypothetical protein
VLKHLAILALAAAPAAAQLRPDEVLVIYDSRIPDSRAVAEFYAGSAKVPGGVGNRPGARPGVRVFDLATSGAPVTNPGTIAFVDFVPRLRTPIRNYLASNNLDRTVRCLVLTKGLPHRIDDSDFGSVGDNPGAFVGEYTSNDVACASVDSELTLLWQDLHEGEAGGAADSKADGLILNPYWKSASPIGSFSTANIRTQKAFTSVNVGPVWGLGGTGATRLTPGDMYLVCRLDGPTLADVEGMVNRAASIRYDTGAHALLLDESGSNGVADASGNSELDNQAALGALRAGDDYERTRDQLALDGRFVHVRYDAASNAPNFFIGPRISPTGGILINEPVALLASYGSNHAGTFPTYSGGSVARVFADSFHYVNGAIFNTIESYNGRDFGGLGVGAIDQEQASHFIAAGGTLAIGHVWEPLADTIADNEFLASNFVLGELSWAEAAWSSIPCLSWMHIVIGDPLARPSRSSEDIDQDQRVGIGDAYAFAVSPTDINRSGAADAADRAILYRTLRFYERSDLINRRP